ncbi:MAG: protein-export chaperone SecB [Bacillota bacterium]|nr:protein-export chaperone SecB [Bacillota bacterium]
MKIEGASIKSDLKFRQYIVDYVRFETNYNYNYDSEDDKIGINFNIDREVQEIGDDLYAVSLIVDIFDDPKEENYPFTMNLKLTGIFELESDIENSNDLLEKNAIAILFPYVRALVSNYTANANVEPLILPPINVIKMVENNKKHK